jgi:hypothetical protein
LVAALAASSASFCVATAPAYAGCGLLGLMACPPPPPPAPAPTPPPPSENADGRLPIAPADNPYGLTELPAHTSASTPLYPLVRGRLPYGVQDGESDGHVASDPATTATVAHSVRLIGGSIARVGIYWPTIEPKQGAFAWDSVDKIYRAYVKEGVRPLMTLGNTPKWAANAIEALNKCSGNSCDVEPDQNKVARLWTLGYELARRYPFAAGFEYRNEPNVYISGKWRIPANRYAKGIANFYAGAVSGRASARVIGGALAFNVGFETYIKQMFDAGARMHALSFHPYQAGETYDRMASNFKWVDEALNTTGIPRIRLIAGEYGASIVAGDYKYALADRPDATGRETVFERLSRQYDDLDRRAPGYVAPVPPLPRIDDLDAALMFTLVEPDPARDTSNGIGFGWLERSAAGAAHTPRYVFCRWRTDIAGLLPWTGDADVSTCPPF